MAKKKSVAAKVKKAGQDEDLDFEAVLADVEGIVSKLESGELNLTESLEQYERGVRQLKNCHAILHAAELRVTVLSGFDADGNPLSEPLPDADPATFDADEGAQNALGEAASTRSSMDDSQGLF